MSEEQNDIINVVGNIYPSDQLTFHLGNWKKINESELRLRSELTMNKGFFSSFTYILCSLPFLEKKYFNNNIFPEIKYYSHNYGSYPNFNVFGKHIKLNYIPNVIQSDAKIEIYNLFNKICGSQDQGEKYNNFFHYKDNYVLANHYLNKYFKFSDEIMNEFNNYYIDNIKDKKVLGIHYRGTDKQHVKWVKHIDIDDMMIIIEDHLKNNNYEKIFIVSDSTIFIDKFIERFKYHNNIIYYNINNNEEKAIHLNNYNLVTTLVTKIRKCKNDTETIDKLENELHQLINNNEEHLKECLVESLLLSKCDTVIKTHSQLSGYAKIFNPDLKIYRITSCRSNYFPDSHIPFLPINNNMSDTVKNILRNVRHNEFNEEDKKKYLDFS